VALSEPIARPPAADRGRVRNPYSALPNWLYPAFVVVALSLFGIFSVWVVFFQHEGYYAPYLSPFYSPLIKVGPIPPGVWVAWAPLVFRLTCLLLPQGLLPLLLPAPIFVRGARTEARSLSR